MAKTPKPKPKALQPKSKAFPWWGYLLLLIGLAGIIVGATYPLWKPKKDEDSTPTQAPRPAPSPVPSPDPGDDSVDSTSPIDSVEPLGPTPDSVDSADSAFLGSTLVFAVGTVEGVTPTLNYYAARTNDRNNVTITGVDNPTIRAPAGTFTVRRSTSGHPLAIATTSTPSTIIAIVTDDSPVTGYIAPGRYVYYCTTHERDMTGTIDIFDPETGRIPRG